MTDTVRVVVILGPTAVGKTYAAIEVAEKIGGEIVSVDSRLLYHGMDIGTAKPSPEEMKKVRHHLVNVADPTETWSLSDFQQAADEAINSIIQRGNLPILVGGTGQYLRAITQGWSPPEIAADPEMRAALERWLGEIGPEELHHRLGRVDKDAAMNIQWQNWRRTIRAWEVILKTGKKFSEQRIKIPVPYHIFQIGLTLPRKQLFNKIDARIDAMLENGFIAEVQTLVNRGYDFSLPAFSAIGYREIYAYLMGDISLETAKALMQKSTRQYVRRQANWFKMTDPAIHWLSVDDQVVENIITLIRNWIGGELGYEN